MHGQDTQRFRTVRRLLQVAKFGVPFCTLAVTNAANGQICFFNPCLELEFHATSSGSCFEIERQFAYAYGGGGGSTMGSESCGACVVLFGHGEGETLFDEGSVSADAGDLGVCVDAYGRPNWQLHCGFRNRSGCKLWCDLPRFR